MTDFQVTKQLKLEELHCTLQQLVHVPTGACVLHIANDDPENLFCLSFQTLPDSSNGVAHILEHTVLCGSKKFPIKDPFFSMTRRSLHTFMNAMTGQDFTCYPASSQVEKDFYNLLEVYLDAVFYPELKQLSFLQEGHRLELHDHQLQIQGVVYNEMKGAMSSAESRLWEALAKALMPDLPYAHNSGGNPREIPNLTYEELLAFHRNFYHPSRCLFFFYGNLPLEKHLKFIEDKALRHVSKMAPLPPLPRQRRFSQPVQTRAYYPIASGESKGGKCEIAFAWLTVPLSDQEKALALSLLDLLLLDTDASPLKMALLRSGLCSEVEASMDLEMSEIPWVIICKGCDPEDAEPLKKILFDTLQKICQKPFETKHVEACLHQLEFDRTEIGGEGSPFGLTLFFRAALLHQHGNDPENALLIHSLFKQLRERLLNPNYLTDLLRATLLENSHFVQLTLEPDNELEKRELEEEQTRLKQREKTLTPKEKEEIQKKMQALSRYQEEVEHQSLDCLPKLQLADVPSVTRDFPLGQNKCDELEIFHHNCFTNHITYADLLFDLPDLSASDLPLVFLFSKLLTEVGCGGREYGENLEFQQAYTGGFQCLMSLHVLQEDPNRCKPSLSIRGKALQHNVPQLFQLFGDVVSSADFTDEKRIQELLSQEATLLRSKLSKNALDYATQIALSGHSLPSYIHNQWNGIPYLEAILRWEKEGGKSLIKELQRIQKQILATNMPHLILSCAATQYEEMKKQHFYGVHKKIAPSASSPWKGNFSLPPAESQVRFISAPVAFTAYGMHTIAYRNAEAPYLYLATELLENCILHKEIREKGGAYGGGASYSPSSGNFHLYAYRDPHLANTEKIFRQAIERIAEGKFNESELLEAKFGVLQTLDAPVSPGNRAIVAYAWQRAGRTLPLRGEFRKKILEAEKKQIAQAVAKHLLPQHGVLVSFLGKELFEKEKKKITTSLPVHPIAI